MVIWEDLPVGSELLDEVQRITLDENDERQKDHGADVGDRNDAACQAHSQEGKKTNHDDDSDLYQEIQDD